DERFRKGCALQKTERGRSVKFDVRRHGNIRSCVSGRRDRYEAAQKMSEALDKKARCHRGTEAQRECTRQGSSDRRESVRREARSTFDRRVPPFHRVLRGEAFRNQSTIASTNQ